jgi:hypothetical protein
MLRHYDTRGLDGMCPHHHGTSHSARRSIAKGQSYMQLCQLHSNAVLASRLKLQVHLLPATCAARASLLHRGRNTVACTALRFTHTPL